jgi:hypothetical protein
MTGLTAQPGYDLPDTDPKVQAARAEMDRLKQRQAELPGIMRDAAVRGDFRAVGELRVELEQLPLRRWAAEYTAVHVELAANPRERRLNLMQRARELAMEVHKRPAWPSHRPM